jgi:hypothetical protein
VYYRADAPDEDVSCCVVALAPNEGVTVVELVGILVCLRNWGALANVSRSAPKLRASTRFAMDRRSEAVDIEADKSRKSGCWRKWTER